MTRWEELEHDMQQPDLAGLLDLVEVFTRRFVVLDEAQATAVVLWDAHTWAIEAARATPTCTPVPPNLSPGRHACSRCAASSYASRCRR